MGWRENMRLVFGREGMRWLYCGAAGNGLDFPINEASIDRANDLENDEIIWPPEAYTEFRAGRDDGRVKRGSEGYVVRDYSYEEKEAMLEARGCERRVEDGGDDFMEELSDEDSEDEPLGSIKKRMEGRKAGRAENRNKQD
jgi:hypothetical protein